jgi:hypothetical protein
MFFGLNYLVVSHLLETKMLKLIIIKLKNNDQFKNQKNIVKLYYYMVSLYTVVVSSFLFYCCSN